MAELVQLTAHLIAERTPVNDQALDLRRLARVLLGQALKQRDLLRHEMDVAVRQLVRLARGNIAVQGRSRQDDALVGFFGGHRDDIAIRCEPVKDHTMKSLAIVLSSTLILALPAHSFSELEMETRYCAGMPRQVAYDGNTRADCLDADMAIEVEFTDNWYTAIGQALYYARVEAEKKANWGKSNRLPDVVPAAIMVCRRTIATCGMHIGRMLDTLRYHAIAMRLWHCKPDADLSLADCDFVDLFEDSGDAQ